MICLRYHFARLPTYVAPSCAIVQPVVSLRPGSSASTLWVRQLYPWLSCPLLSHAAGARLSFACSSLKELVWRFSSRHLWGRYSPHRSHQYSKTYIVFFPRRSSLLPLEGSGQHIIMTNEVIIERCHSVIKNHPNSGSSVGPLRKWLKELMADKDRGRDLRKIAKEVHKDNALADKVCSMVEQFSTLKGDPWKRQLGKNTDKPKTTERSKAGPAKGGSGADTDKKPNNARKEEPRGSWPQVQPNLTLLAWTDAQGEQRPVMNLIPSADVTRESTGLTSATAQQYNTDLLALTRNTLPHPLAVFMPCTMSEFPHKVKLHLERDEHPPGVNVSLLCIDTCIKRNGLYHGALINLGQIHIHPRKVAADITVMKTQTIEMSVEWWKAHPTKEWEWLNLTKTKQKELVGLALDGDQINLDLYSFRDINEPDKKKTLKTALFRVPTGGWVPYYPRSGRNGMIFKVLSKGDPSVGPDTEVVWAEDHCSKDLTKLYQEGKALSAWQGAIVSPRGVGMRLSLIHI